MIRHRHPSLRRTSRQPFRRANRPGFRLRWRAPDDLAAGLTAFRRAIRSHRRLAKLAPRFFDAAVVERERLEREDRRRWMEEWEPALARAYGCEPRPYDPSADLPPLPPPHVAAKVDRELADLRFWLAAAQAALELHRQRRPHGLMSWSRMARLLEVGMELRLLACGFAPGQPPPEPSYHDQVCADLNRAYGHRCDPVAKEPSLSALGSQSNQPTDSGPILHAESPPHGQAHSESDLLPPPPVDSSSPAAAPVPIRRCDAYSRLGRQLRARRNPL